MALVARRLLKASASFAAGAAISNVILALLAAQLRGNLAPIAAALVLLLIAVPTALGGGVGGGLRYEAMPDDSK